MYEREAIDVQLMDTRTNLYSPMSRTCRRGGIELAIIPMRRSFL